MKATEVILRSWKRGVAVITCGASTLRLAPPLTIERKLLDVAIDTIENAIFEVEKA